MKSLFLTAALGAATATVATADPHANSADALRIYAAMAKLEANMAEAAGAVMLGALAGGDREIRAEALEDFNSDIAQIEGYVAVLRATELSESQAAAVESLVSQWTPIAETGRELLGNDDDNITEPAFDWWESLDGLDDLVDDQLEAILETQGIEMEG